MYIPTHFEESRSDVLHELMRSQPLATLVTLSSDGLDANHIPLHLVAEPAPFGTLRGHVARQNPLWRDLSRDVETLAIFHGPQSYITPSWYPSKQETGKAVPTWNYVVVHAYGILRIIDDAEWVRDQIDALTAHSEAGFAAPWAVADAPHDYLDKMIGAIVGIEMVITRLTGKWKTSQNQPLRNQAGVVRGLDTDGPGAAPAMAALVKAAMTQIGD